MHGLMAGARLQADATPVRHPTRLNDEILEVLRFQSAYAPQLWLHRDQRIPFDHAGEIGGDPARWADATEHFARHVLRDSHMRLMRAAAHSMVRRSI